MKLDKELLIGDQKFGTQLLIYSLFMLTGFGFFVLGLVNAQGPDRIAIIIITACVSIIPFGICVGLRNIIRVLKERSKIINGDITIVEMKVLDKQHISHQEKTKHTLLIFGEKNNVYVNAQEAKSYKVGDVCYRVFLNTASSKRKDIGFPYNKKKYILGEDLAPYLDKSYRQEDLDPRYFEE